MSDIDPNFFEKIAKIWVIEFTKNKKEKEIVMKFAKFIDKSLEIPKGGAGNLNERN